MEHSKISSYSFKYAVDRRRTYHRFFMIFCSSILAYAFPEMWVVFGIVILLYLIIIGSEYFFYKRIEISDGAIKIPFIGITQIKIFNIPINEITHITEIGSSLLVVRVAPQKGVMITGKYLSEQDYDLLKKTLLELTTLPLEKM